MTRSALVRVLAVCVTAVLAVHARGTRAQWEDPPRILLVPGPGVSHMMERDLVTVYADLGVVGTDPDYPARAQAAGVAPTSTEAMAALLPAYGVSLGVVAERVGFTLRVSVYSGATGAPLCQDALQLEGNRLNATAALYLRSRARRALDLARTAPQPDAQWTPESAPTQPDETAQPDADPTANDVSLEPTNEADGQAEPPPLRVTLSAGLGAAMHAMELPAEVGTMSTDAALVPALDVGFAGEAAGTALMPGWQVEYRSTLGYTQVEHLPGDVERSSAARKHELLADATLRIGGDDADTGVSVPVALGFALRDMRAEVEMGIPRYTLGGPHARVLVRIPIADGALIAELGPEVQWLPLVSRRLERRGVGASGAAIGVEARLTIPLDGRWSGRLLYRESHAVFASAFGGSFLDSQRFVTLGVGASYE